MARFLKLHRVSDDEPILLDIHQVKIIVPVPERKGTELAFVNHHAEGFATVSESVAEIWEMLK